MELETFQVTVSDDNEQTDTYTDKNNTESSSVSSSIPKKQSEAWKHFTKANDYETSKKVTCNYCFKQFICRQGSTTNLNNHIKKRHYTRLQNTGSNESVNIMNLFTSAKVTNIYILNIYSILYINLYYFKFSGYMTIIRCKKN